MIHLYSQTEDRRCKPGTDKKPINSNNKTEVEDGKGEAENRQKTNQI